jgi:hypothetical protein
MVENPGSYNYGCTGEHIEIPSQYVQTSDISYTITGIDKASEIPSNLKFNVTSSSMYGGCEFSGNKTFTPTTLTGTLSAPSCNNLVSDTLCPNVSQSCMVTGWSVSLNDDGYILYTASTVNETPVAPPTPVEPGYVEQVTVINNLPGNITTLGRVLGNRESEDQAVSKYGSEDITVSLPTNSVLNNGGLCNSCWIQFNIFGKVKKVSESATGGSWSVDFEGVRFIPTTTYGTISGTFVLENGGNGFVTLSIN